MQIIYPFWKKNIKNFIQSQSGIGREQDASEVLKLCKSLKDTNDAFQYYFTIDESVNLSILYESLDIQFVHMMFLEIWLSLIPQIE